MFASPAAADGGLIAVVGEGELRRRRPRAPHVGRTVGPARRGSEQRLLGREQELDTLQQALHDLDRGEGGVVVVAGEPGIGKSRLVGEVCRRGDAQGHLVLAGRGAEYERDLPFGPFMEALDDYLRSLDEAFFDELGRQALGELAVVFPSMARFALDRPPLHAERYRSHLAVRALLGELSRSRPVVLALDDLHWGDAASIELLIHLLRSPPPGPVLLLLAFRVPQVPAALGGAVEAAAREGSATFLRLSPLSPEDADELMGADVARVIRDELYSESGGNPFYVEELLRAAVRRPSWEALRAAGLPEIVPPAVRAALVAELHDVSPSALVLLQAAAVAGDPFEVDLAAEIAELPEEQARAELDELLRYDIVRPTDVPRRFRFRHPLLRTAIYELSGPGWRLGAHRRAAAALAARDAPVEVRAHHVQRFAGTGDEEAIALLTEAGRTAREPFSAALWFEAALRLLPTSGEHEVRRLELAIARTTALGAAGRISDFQRALHETLEQLPSDAAAVRADLVAFGACHANALGHAREFFLRLTDALARLPDTESPQAVKLQVELCANRLVCNEFEQARAFAETAVAAASRVGDPALLAGAAAARVVAQCVTDVEAAQRHVAEAEALLEGLSDEELAGYPDAAVTLVWAELQLERFDQAISHVRRTIELCRATRQERLLAFALAAQAAALVAKGELRAAAELADACVGVAQLSVNAQLASFMLAADWTVTAAKGDTARAARSAQEHFPLVDALEPGPLAATAGLA
ncbi:MAG: AAA family ATPase, partial [Actinomycetota bacterium]|nr:AAA family ATPase [Actinomycetota bacterium]